MACTIAYYAAPSSSILVFVDDDGADTVLHGCAIESTGTDGGSHNSARSLALAQEKRRAAKEKKRIVDEMAGAQAAAQYRAWLSRMGVPHPVPKGGVSLTLLCDWTGWTRDICGRRMQAGGLVCTRGEDGDLYYEYDAVLKWQYMHNLYKETANGTT